MNEAGVVIINDKPLFWHLPQGRTSVSLPDSRELWDVLWSYRKDPSLGFAHSHPGSGVPVPSQTDLTTFSAIERALGRKLSWWITSSDQVIYLEWAGPGAYDYDFREISDPSWIVDLRNNS